MITKSPGSVIGSFVLMAIVALLILTYPSVARSACPQASRAAYFSDEEIVNAIGRAENSVKYPYGIKSINTHGDAVYARRICLNTVRNNRRRFAEQTKEQDFIVFLGSRFCPPAVHPLNRSWVGNVKYFLTKGTI
jgi:hypothetical protein